MQAAHPAHGFDSGPQIQVIGIAQNDVSAQFFERVLGHPFHGAQRSHRHKYGGLDFSVRSEQATGAGSAVGGIDVECDGHFVDCSNGAHSAFGTLLTFAVERAARACLGQAKGCGTEWLFKSVI